MDYSASHKSYKTSILSQDFIATAAVAAAHFLILAYLLFNFSNTKNSQQILSFSVNMMEVASSSNQTVSKQINGSVNNKKSSKKLTNNPNSINLAKETANKEEKADNSKNNKNNSINSIEQTAVLAPSQKAVYDAAYLNNSAPTYPILSRKLGEEGLVILIALVNAQGKLEKIEIKSSSGYSRLDNEAINTVKNWKFVAAKDRKTDVASWVEIPVNFVLEKSKG